MAILLTGGSGFIGQHLLRKLKKTEEVVVLDINKPKEEVEFVQGNVLDIEILKKLNKKYNITKIYHLASPMGVDFTDKNRLITLEVIIQGTKNIINIFGKKIDFFFFSSSSEIYGNSSLASESDVPKPFSTYGVAKIATEEYVKVLSEKYNFRYVIGRFFNVYGPNQSINFVIPKFINKALNNEDIIINGDGSQKRCFTYVGEVVDVLSKFANSNKKGIFNVGNPNSHYSILELAQTIINLTKSKSKIVNSPAISHDVAERIPKIDKIKVEMNWNPKVLLPESIQKILDSKKF